MKQLLLLLIFLLSSCSTSAILQVRSPNETLITAINPDLAATYQAVSEQVVGVYACDAKLQIKTLGTGFIYKVDANYIYFVTNAHVLGDAPRALVFFDEVEAHEVKILGKFKAGDLAALRLDRAIKPSVTPLEMANSALVKAGEAVFAIGNPLEKQLTGTVTSGYISAPHRITLSPAASDLATPLIQSDAVLNAGNSGGPLFNALGKVIGINAYKFAEAETSYDLLYQCSLSIHINFALRVLAQLENQQKALYNTLGLILSPDLIVTGFASYALVQTKTLVQIGDKIEKLNDYELFTRAEYALLIQSTSAPSINVTITRGQDSFSQELFFQLRAEVS